MACGISPYKTLSDQRAWTPHKIGKISQNDNGSISENGGILRMEVFYP